MTMKFNHFAQTLEKLESTASRNELTVILADLLKELKPEEAKLCMYLLEGRLVPKFVNLEFNISSKLILRAIGELIDDPIKVGELYARIGDEGLVAEELNSHGNSEDVEITYVYSALTQIATSSGKGSQEEKIRLYKELFQKITPISARYLTRMIIGDMRLGLSDKTMLDSLSWYMAGDKSLRKKIDTAYGNRADIGELTELILAAKDISIEEIINKFELKPGTPVAAKLVEREKDSESVWERMPNCFVQPKLDGLRGQIHYVKPVPHPSPTLGEGVYEGDGRGTGSIFSRNMESLTEQFPEITRDVAKLDVESIILDSELIGYDKETEKFMLFQETIQRRRKYDVDAKANQIPVKAMCFDILYLNGKDLTQEPIEVRLRLLKEIIEKNPTDSLDMLETIQPKSVEELNDYFEEKVNAGLEGIITKQIESNYEPGTRNYKWIKLKANTRSDLVDTIDVVVLGYYKGKGARAKFGVGTLLTAVYNEDDDKYYSIGKVGSGFSDEMLHQIFKDLEEIKIVDKPSNVEVDKTLVPDVWVEPKIIMEIVADEITRSPNHTAARGVRSTVPKDDSTKGLSIRFPRMKKWNRTDKDVPNTVTEIIRMYELRKSKA